jgi:Domain of unknown function (DUF5916)/Carbohydrate family 9 binding domain-like
MNRLIARPALTFIVVAALAGRAFAAQDSIPVPSERPHHRIPRVESEIKIDGVLDEEAWEKALQVKVDVEIDPRRNHPAPVATLAYLAYDDDHLYAAFRAHDPEPAAIRATLADRDTTFNDDFVGLMLDTFNDDRRAVELFVNPLGVQMDLSRDETAGGQEDEAWDTLWSSAGKIGEDGYVVEMAIPFSSLRFQRSEGEQTWGVAPFRSYPRSIRHQMAATAVDPDDSCFLCQMPRMTGFDGVTPGRNIEINPTLTASRLDQRSAPASGLAEGDVEDDLGLTARWGMTPNLTLSGTLNPDFSQVEADAAQFDVNSQFALFFPERRPFFLEGADFFDTPFDVVHTRAVADPAWGVKLTGKEGRNGIGLFVAEDETTQFLLPFDQLSRTGSLDGFRSTAAVMRYRRDLGATSILGAIATHREGGDYFNSVYGIDGRWRPGASDTISVQLLGSQSEYPTALLADEGVGLAREDRELLSQRLEGSALRVGYDHSSREWNWYAQYEDIDPEFRADLGFMPRVGYSFLLGGLQRTWWSDRQGSWYSNIRVGADWDQTEGADGTLLEREVEAWVQLQGPLQSFYMIDTGRRDRFWNGVTFEESFTHFEVSMRPTGDLNFYVLATVADTIDFAHTRAGDLLRLRPGVGYNLGRNLRLTLDHDLQRVDVDGGRLLELNVTQTRATYQLNLRTFVRAVFQYTRIEYDTDLYTAAEVPEEDEHLFSQLLFSYKLNPRTVLFLGYSDDQLGGIQDGIVTELTRERRSLFFKVGYALVL